MGKNAQKRKPVIRLSNILMTHSSLRGEFVFGENRHTQILLTNISITQGGTPFFLCARKTAPNREPLFALSDVTLNRYHNN